MAAKNYLNLVAGRLKQVVAVVVSLGAGNDGDLVALDATGKLDPSVMPSGFGQNTATIEASENLAANDVVNIHSSTGEKVRKADAAAVGKEVHGFVKASFTSGQPALVYLSGNTITGLTSKTPGARQYLSTTPGILTETAPAGAGNVVQMVGIALTDTSVAFEPEEPVELV